MIINEKAIAKALGKRVAFEKWCAENPDLWNRVLDRADVCDGSIGANQLLDGIVPRRLIAPAAAQLMEERPDLHIKIRSSIDTLI